ncbi:Zinc finger SWIM-type [Arabidopsis suecica]|uniref:Zinc finger SWIM-type n=1 Tax=Arabidopsis suecica TaxID=45249 RepID=A0A8T1YQZ7_ARASU|nr:Zinc finger SWIM-type [Arabidopsis suecica]
MDKSVMMLVGKWKCLEGGMWRFRMSERYFAKCVDVEDEDKFDAVEDKIAKVYGIDKKKTKMELSFWYEGGDAVFTQQKMPPVSVDSESSLTKFKKIRLEKGGMNMYVSVDEDEDDLPERGGQSELSAYDENVLRAVAIAETGHRGSFQAMGGQDLGSHCLPYTYEEVDFLAEVDEIEQVYRAINVKRGRGADYLEEVGANSGETLVSCEISEDYDFDKMRDRIDREYPVDWDPYNTKRVKSWSAAGDSEVRVEDDGTNISGGKRITTEGTSAAIGGENIRVSPDARTRACDYREVEGWGQDDAVMFSYEQLAQSLQNTEVEEINGAEMDSEGGRGTGAGDGPETAELLSIELAQEVMSPVMIYSACETITQENTDAEDDGSGSSRRPTQMSDYGVISLVSPIINSTEGTLADERCTNGKQPRRCSRLSLRGRKNVAAEDLGNVSSGGPELVDEEQLENLSMSPIGNNLGAEHGDSTGPEEGALALMAIGNQRMTPRRRFNVGVGEESTLNYNAMCEIPEDDPIFLGDATPFKDNAVAVAGDKANMNLRKSEDCMYIGRVFRNKNELHKALSIYSIKRLFNFRISASDKTRVIAVCGDRKCRWRIYATYHKDSESVEIRTATLKHTCDVEARSKYGKKATASILGELLKAKYAHGKKGPRACELPKVVLSEINVSISYMKAWYAREVAMKRARGTEEESYKFLKTYLHLLKTTNPGTLSSVDTTYSDKGTVMFKYLFFAFGASIAGYKYLRKVIVIDGTQTKGKYKSCLVAASGQDGNYQIFPLAFGVIDGENASGWTWFFTKLKQFVPDEEDLVFVSDRHQAIYAGLRSVYPLAKHAACTVHLFRNVKHNFKSAGLASMVSNAARAYTVGDLRYWFEEIQKRNMECANYLIEIGISHWTLAYFPGMRYNLMSSNISESLNAALQKAIDFPIVTLVESIRTMLMRWFCERREKAKKALTRCTPEIEQLLIDHLKEATDCAVIASTEWIYQVNDGYGTVFTVDLRKKTCTCRVFDVLMVPCCHALAAVGIRNVDIYSLVGKYAFVSEWRKLWTEHILPPPKERDTEVPLDISQVDVNAPKTKRPSGRPRTVRIPSQGEHHGKGGRKKKEKNCTTCGKNGHNRATDTTAWLGDEICLGTGSPRGRGIVFGVPKRCWCGEDIVTLTSKSDANPCRRYYRCGFAFKHRLRNDEHTFKWVDEALLNEIDTLKGKNGELEQEVKEIKTQRLEFEKEIFEKLPKHLRVSIVLLVGKTCYRHLGPLILSGKAGMRLALDPSVLRETSLALLESHPQNISIGSPIHLFVLRCVKARNPVACYLESIRLAAVEGLIKEAMDMLGDIPDPSPKILFTKGLYLVSVNRPMDAITAMNQFKHEVVSSRKADRVATLVMTDIKKIAPDQLRFTWTGYTCYLIHPPRRYSECSKCNFWNPCPLCVNWWVL